MKTRTPDKIIAESLKSADDITWEENMKTAGTDTYVVCAVGDTDESTVDEGRKSRALKSERWRSVVRNPKYRRGFMWNGGIEVSTPSVTSTLYHKPLPSVPLEDYDHTLVTDTIAQYPHLFKVVTPIRSYVLESLLRSHPNRNFVESVLKGFREGFWPSASAERSICKEDGNDNQ